MSFRTLSKKAEYLAARDTLTRYIQLFDLLPDVPDHLVKAFFISQEPHPTECYPEAVGTGIPIELRPNAYLYVRKDHPNEATAPYFSIFRSSAATDALSDEDLQKEFNHILKCEVHALNPDTHLLWDDLQYELYIDDTTW